MRQPSRVIDPLVATYPPQKLAALMLTMAEEGHDAADILFGTGLTQEQVLDSDTRTSVAQLHRACRNAMRLCKQPDLALRVGARLRFTSYGMYGYALVCASTVRQSCELALRYHLLATPVMPISVEISGFHLIWRMHPSQARALRPGDTALRDFLVAMQMSIHVTLTNDVVGQRVDPVRVRLSSAMPPLTAHYPRLLGCMPEFGSEVDELWYPASILEWAPTLANSLTAGALSQTCNRLMAEVTRQESVTGRVHAELLAVPGRFPSLEEVAERQGLSARTLRRHLSAEGRSFQNVLDEVRLSLATEYLHATRMNVDDIGAALGFTEPAAFRRAFKRWTQTSPAEFRRQHRAAHGR